MDYMACSVYTQINKCSSFQDSHLKKCISMTSAIKIDVISHFLIVHVTETFFSMLGMYLKSSRICYMTW